MLKRDNVVLDFDMTEENSTLALENTASDIKEDLRSKEAGLALLCLNVFQSLEKNKKTH